MSNARTHAGGRVSVGKSINSLINHNKTSLAPRRGVRNPLWNKCLCVPTLEIGPVGFQGLAGNVPTRSALGRDADQHVLAGTKRFIWTSGFGLFFQRMAARRRV